MTWTVFLLLDAKIFSYGPWNFLCPKSRGNCVCLIFPVCSIWSPHISLSRTYLKIWVSLSFWFSSIAPQSNPRVWRNKIFYWLQTIISEPKSSLCSFWLKLTNIYSLTALTVLAEFPSLIRSLWYCSVSLDLIGGLDLSVCGTPAMSCHGFRCSETKFREKGSPYTFHPFFQPRYQSPWRWRWKKIS